VNVLLKEIATVSVGNTFRSKLQTNPEGNAQVIQMKDLNDCNELDFEHLVKIEMPKIKPSHVARKGDLLFRTRGQTNTAAIVGTDIENAVVAAPLLRVRCKTDLVAPEYLCWFINQPESQAYFSTLATGSGIRQVGKQVLESLQVILPPLEKQKLIAELAGLCSREQQILLELANKRPSLVNRILMQSALESQGGGIAP